MSATAPDLELVLTGVDHDVELFPSACDGSKSRALPRNTLPIGLPPVLPSYKDQLEEYLINIDSIPLYETERSQRFWPRKADASTLFDIDVCPLHSDIIVERDRATGKLNEFKESLLHDTECTAKNSTLLRRLPGPPSEAVRGSATNYPFWPGGLEEPSIETFQHDLGCDAIDFESDLLHVPVGFTSGMFFETKKISSSTLQLEDVAAPEASQCLSGPNNTSLEDVSVDKTQVGLVPVLPDIVDDVVQIGHITTNTITAHDREKSKDYEFAVKVDVTQPVDDFHTRIPEMAYEWPFELDIFQKQAVLHLENHENVFVAAHTSAGKTVVAEYAIALSMKHMTRTIYTSPIKALSNQKFRDFKVNFGDVGLITGDVQINQEAACLIMTTEILRSMLYKGSDVIRDLEWVIFDEVHYINDSERGVVWEEVLIMLPQHVNIILLSATVPNTMEFADWVGRTKRKKVYVVSTLKRPVPLEHYLYTGNSSKTSAELFQIVDSSKTFLIGGYNKAADAKKERATKFKQAFGAKGLRGGDPKQEKNLWLSVIEMLRKKDKLPVVCFTFSRKRIDENTLHMSSVDLTTEREKGKIHMFFQRCVSRLKGTDRILPQVDHMSHLLKRGIGVHHSGILPILKEVVEMLFQRGLVKVLFATETFAMGVNMPARTVVFDSIRKHDGKEFRNLLPGEYVQMAGRAGRRGLDSTGTVIVLMKGDMPPVADLQLMMLGQATRLESQFRVTYSMILNLLRVAQLRVEDMMKRSFCEVTHQREAARHQQLLAAVSARLQTLPALSDAAGDLPPYYHACHAYHTLNKDIKKLISTHPQLMKVLSAGRVVVINNARHAHTLAVILKAASASRKEKCYHVLTACQQGLINDDGWNEEQSDDDWRGVQPVLTNQLHVPQPPCSQEMLEVTMAEIYNITTKVLQADVDDIFDNCKMRQIPRFKDAPPSDAVLAATEELLQLAVRHQTDLPKIDLTKDLNLRDITQVEMCHKLRQLESKFGDYKCVHEPDFNANFRAMRTRMKLKEECDNYEYLLSEDSLKLIPEYQEKIKVLQDLFYIDKSKLVQLKGRVACEISNHELVLTELVFQNKLSGLQPGEIAALLSCAVFQQRNCSEPNLCPVLEKAKADFLEVASMLNMEDDFNFGLMEVTFEWTRGMPFSDITQLTDVQEGIIVRTIQRLDEVLKDVRNAAMVIGDPTLRAKLEEASTLIKRDIVFAASLYTQ